MHIPISALKSVIKNMLISITEINNSVNSYKCRIPQRIPPARTRFSAKSKLNEQLVPINY